MAEVGDLEFKVRYNDDQFKAGVKRTEAEAKAHAERLKVLSKLGYSKIGAEAIIANDRQVAAARRAAQEQQAILERAFRQKLLSEKQYQSARLKLAQETNSKIQSIQTGGVAGGPKVSGGAGGLAGFGVAAGAAVALNAVKNFAKESIDAAGRVEKSFGMLRAATRAAGQDFEEAKKNVQELAADGTLSIEETTRSYALLVQQGIKANDAFKAIEAGKKLATFRGISGSAAESFAGFVKALNSGEVELAENLDPSLKSVIRSLGGMEKISQSTALKQELLNEVVKRGSALTADYEASLNGINASQTRLAKSYEALQVAVGQKLAGSFSKAAQLGSQFINFLTRNIDTITTFTGVFLRSIPGVGQFVAVFQTLVELLADTPEEILADQLEAIDELNAKAAEGVATQEEKNKLLEEEAKLIAGLPANYQAAVREIRKGTDSIEEQARAILKLKADAAQNQESAKRIARGQEQGPLEPVATGLLDFEGNPVVFGGGGLAPGKGPDQRTAFLDPQLKQTLDANQKAFDEYIATVEGSGRVVEADTKLRELNAEAVKQATFQIETYYKQGLEAELAAAEEAQRIALKTNEDNLRAKAGYVDREQEIVEAGERKKLSIQLAYAERTAEALASVNAQAIQLIQAQGTSQTLGALGGLAGAGGGALKEGGALGGLGLGALGGALAIGGVALGAGALIAGVFEDAAKEEAEREKKRLAEIERAREEAHRRELDRLRIQGELFKLNIQLEKRLLELDRQRRETRNRLADLDAKTESEKLVRTQRQAAADAAALLDIQRAKPQKGIGRGGTDIGGGLSSSIAGATQAELEILRGSDPKAAADVLAAIQKRNVKTQNVRDQLKTKISGVAKAKSFSEFFPLFDFYFANRALLTPAERSAFEKQFASVLPYYQNKALAATEIKNVATGGLLGGSTLLNSAELKAEEDAVRAQQADIIKQAARGSDTLIAEGSAIAKATASGEVQQERIATISESLVAAAEAQNQLETQRFRDQLEAINREAAAAEATGQTVDTAGAKRGLAGRIASFLGLDINNLDPNAGKALDLEDKAKFDLMIDLLRETADATTQTAENTSLKAIENLNVVDVASRLLRFGGDNIRLPSVALDPNTSRGIDLLTGRSTSAGTDKLGSIDQTLKDIRALVAVQVEFARASAGQIGADLLIKRILDDLKNRTAA